MDFCPQSTAPCQIPLPGGFPCPRVPAENPLTKEKIELGRFLFYDTKMSGPGLDGQPGQACASCHDQAKAFTDGRATAKGSTGQDHPRSSMSLTNAVYESTLTWANNTVFTLEDQALVPMFTHRADRRARAGRRDDRSWRTCGRSPVTSACSPKPFRTMRTPSASTRLPVPSPRSAYADLRQYSTALSCRIRPLAARSFKHSEVGECFHCHDGFNLRCGRRARHDHARDLLQHRPVQSALLRLRLPTLDFPYCDPPPSAEA